LQRHSCLLYGHGGALSWEFVVDGVVKGVEVRGPLRANNGDLIRDAAVAGLGIVRLPEFIVADSLRSGQLVSVLDAFLPDATSVYAVYPQHRQSSVTIRAFVEFLRKHLKKNLAG